MVDPKTILALAGPPSGGDANPFASLILMGLIFGIFYFVLIMPMRRKQKKLEEMVKALKPGDNVVINPGILGTVVGIENDVLLVRIDEKTRIKVLRSAVAGLQGQAIQTEKH
jgi:preprotein translocase subunit YajC